ncbi:MAG: PUR family DNA/RNA-binding protein [Flavobacteriaceae bacterium]|nr:PUR family DNA/RNA-binding protein [Flavobacteriaceae bacterium]
MKVNENRDNEEILSKQIRVGRRTYFFDVRATKADDYYLTITESKKHTEEDGSFYYKKHKIYLYKEDFKEFTDTLTEVTDFIFKERGDVVISDTHRDDYVKKEYTNKDLEKETTA